MAQRQVALRHARRRVFWQRDKRCWCNGWIRILWLCP